MTFNKTCELKATNPNIKSLTRQQVFTQTSIKIQFTWSAKWNPLYFCHRLELFWSGTRRTTLLLSHLSRHKALAMLPFFFSLSWSSFPHLGIEAPFGSFSTSLSFRTMIWSYWVNRCCFTKKGKGIFLPFPPFKVTKQPWPFSLFCLNSLNGEKDFIWCLYLAQGLHLLFPGCTEDF